MRERSVGTITALFIALATWCQSAWGAEPATEVKLSDYSQWKLALADGGLADPKAMETLPGFQVEMVRKAEAGEGSWISLAFDAQGRLLIGREDKGIWRLNWQANRPSLVADKLELINDALLEPRGLLVAHDSLYVTANNAKGLYRLRDLDGDDKFEEVKLLRELPGQVGHGRNGLALGPDGQIYVALGNNVRVPAQGQTARSAYRHYGLDRLLPCVWNEFLFDSDVLPPAGYIARTNANGDTWEVIAGGFRNPYDVAFNRDGELFTYDADMEWDVGAPWYRATCVMHVVPGGEYGWRQGTSVWPDHYADSLPRVADVGLGSPTGVTFGEGCKFPLRYQRAMYILDWAYGRILAVHLTPQGASYRGQVETFVKGKPLNLTDVAVGPDGAMYFTVGGRGTRSALYRIRYIGEKLLEETQEPGSAPPLQATRRDLEPLLTSTPENAIDKLWPKLGNSDPFVRQTARVALENQPISTWLPRLKSETQGLVASTALLALARVGETAERDLLWERLNHWLAQKLDADARLTALRGTQLAMLRQGPRSAQQQTQLRQTLEPTFPAKSAAENYLLIELLVALDSPTVVGPTLKLWSGAADDRERLFYLFALRQAKAGWTPDMRRAYLAQLKQAESFAGAHYLPRFLTYIRSDAIAMMPDAERAALAAEIDALGRVPAVASDPSTPARPEVRKWTTDELLAELAALKNHQPNIAKGRELYATALCARCHRHQDQGLAFGPDLTHVSGRFGPRDVLEATVAPARSVDDKYRTLILETSDGETLSGFFVGGDAESLFVASDPLRPAAFRRVSRGAITSRKTAPTSPMPDGLLNAFTPTEIADLMAYLLSEK